MIAPGLRRWVAAAEPRGLREAAALRWLNLDEAGARQATDGAPWLLEDDGELSMAALAFLVDSTLGAAGAVAGGYRTGVTMSLRCDVVARPAAAYAAIEARVLHVDDDGGFVTGTITANDGEVVGHATLRTAALRGPMSAGAPHAAEAAVGTGAAAASVDAMLGIRSVDAGDGRSSLVANAPPNLANGVGLLHGGAVAGLAQRATRHALAALVTGATVHDVVLEVDFLRAVTLDDRPVKANGRVTSRSRRFAWAEAAVLTADDVTAARARTVVRVNDEGPS